MSGLERSYDITLEALGDALDLKDAETEGHSKRVTAFTIAMARHRGLSDDQVRVIARGAFLHDIGKMAIPDGILRKPGPLTAEEVSIMREHCYHGYQMLRKIPFLTEASDIVYSHQEKWDGSGYPVACVARKFRLAPESSLSPTRSTPSRRIALTAPSRLCRPPKRKSNVLLDASLTLTSYPLS